jgi:hypothetical protein
VSDTYYRDRIARAAVEAENARVRRMEALQEALYAVRTQDDEVLSPDQRAALSAATDAVADLRRTW